MVKCINKNCNSIRINVQSLNFATRKPEGEAAAKGNEERYSFLCFDCNSSWIAEPQVRKDYYEYLWLKSRTELIARDMMKDGSYVVAPYIDSNELMRRTELAKKLSNSYTHVLDISPDEWHEIHLDAI
jgi:hypothetical protein